MSKSVTTDFISRALAIPTDAASIAADPQRTVQLIQSGEAAKAALTVVSREMAFATAIGNTFAKAMPMMSDAARIEVIALIACLSSAKGRRAILEYVDCPPEAEEFVAEYDATKAAEADARKAEKAAEREAKERAKYEELRLRFEGDDAQHQPGS